MKYYLRALQNYATFTGRANGTEYWMFVLFNVIFAVAIAFIVPALSSLYSLAVLLPGIAVGVRRMHDVGKSGWFLLIPIYNLILLVSQGDSGENQYGAPPDID